MRIILGYTLMKLLIFCFLNHTYYISSAGSDNNNGESMKDPWRTIDNLRKITLKAGDTVFFECGTTFEGGLSINSTGVAGNPVVFTHYGKGPAPVFQNKKFGFLVGNIFQLHGSYIVIDGLCMKDGVPSLTDSSNKVRAIGGIYISDSSMFNVVRNCEMINMPVAIKVYGQYNLITHNNIHDCPTPLYPKYWGPIGVVICNSNNEIAFNQITSYIAKSLAWGMDGGAIELDDNKFDIDNIYIHHNYSFNNEGFLEAYENKDSTKSMTNLTIAYNVSDRDYQAFFRMSWLGSQNVKVQNNTVVFTRPKNNVVTPSIFDYSYLNKRKQLQKNMITSCVNNIFVVANGNKVSPYMDFERTHNLYYDMDGKTDPSEVIGPFSKLSEGEIIAWPMFKDTCSGDYRLDRKSPAVNSGIRLQYKEDATHTPVPQNGRTDIGAYEWEK